MPIEAKEVLSYLGLPDTIDSIDKFKETFEPAFIKKDPAVISEDKEFFGKLIGKKTGAINTAMKRALKRNGVELKDDEIKDSMIEEVIEYAIDKTYKINGEKVLKLQEEISKGSDEKQLALQAALDKQASDFKALEGSFLGIKTEYEDYKTKTETDKKNFKKNQQIEKLRSAIQWGSKAKEDDLKREGFLALLERTYKFDIDETDNLIVTNAKGEKIPNPKVNSTFKSPEEIVKEFAIEKGVWAINPHETKNGSQQKINDFNKSQKAETGRTRTRSTMIPTGA